MLGEPRKPWLDAVELKEKFHALTARHHPDIAGEAGDFQALNAAYQTLREPRTRLRHLLELECASIPGADAPPGIAALFMKMSALQQAFNAFKPASTPLAQALLAPERWKLIRSFKECLAVLDAGMDELLEELRRIDSEWPDKKPVDRLAALCQGFSYLSKWTGQAREALLSLNA